MHTNMVNKSSIDLASPTIPKKTSFTSHSNDKFNGSIDVGSKESLSTETYPSTNFDVKMQQTISFKLNPYLDHTPQTC